MQGCAAKARMGKAASVSMHNRYSEKYMYLLATRIVQVRGREMPCEPGFLNVSAGLVAIAAYIRALQPLVDYLRMHIHHQTRDQPHEAVYPPQRTAAARVKMACHFRH